MRLTTEEIGLIRIAFDMRINYIQTGDITFGAADAREMGKPEMVQALSDDQMQLILTMRALVARLERIK